MIISIESLTKFCVAALRGVGLSEQDAQDTATALVTTDAMGVFTHGTKLLDGYLKRLSGGGYRATGRPRIEREGPGWAVIDGESALGQVGCQYALQVGLDKARRVGVAYVGVHNTGHIGAAGYYAAQAARAGFIAMVTGNDMPSVAAPGSRKAVLGSNPIAYGVPTGDDYPVLLDMATAAVAGGKVYAAHTRGEPIPNTWLIGPDGLPTSDGSLYPHQAALAPMAGHKGYGMGLWAEFLSAIIPGGLITWEVGSWIFDPLDRPSQHNAGFILLDVAAIAPTTPAERTFVSRVRQLIDEIHSAPTATGIERVLVPGEREWEKLRQTQQQGIQLPADVVEKLAAIASRTGLTW
jgi:ureidoglycolate dehydrogenase (NAD+)